MVYLHKYYTLVEATKIAPTLFRVRAIRGEAETQPGSHISSIS